MKKVTVSAIKPVLHILKAKVLKVSDGDTNLTESIKGKILGYLQSKYDDAHIDGLLSVCTYIDSRFKESYFEVNNALVKDCLAREGIEIIEEQNNEPATSYRTHQILVQTSVRNINCLAD